MDPWSEDADDEGAGAWAEPANAADESPAEPTRRRARPPAPQEFEEDDLPDEPLSEEERVAQMLGALPKGAQVAVYRTSPQWASGHLQTITMQGGDTFDLARLDDLAAYWGGGNYRFRPMVSGKFLRGGRTMTIDGPTMYQGRPHPNDPRRHQRPDVIDTVATVPAPAQPGAPYIIRGDGQAVDVMAQLLQRLGDRLDRIEQRMVAPLANVDPMGQVQGALQLLAAIRKFDRHDEPDADDEDEEEEEEEPHDTRSMIEKLILKKLEQPGGFLDDGPPATPQAPPATTGPRLIRAGDAATTAPQAPPPPPVPAAPPGFPQAAQPAAPAQPPPPDPAQMLAWFKTQPPAAQAQLFATVGDQLGPEATAELGKLLAR